LNELVSGARLSRDIDLFHDSDAAVAASWDADRQLLERTGLGVRVLRERPSYVEAEVTGLCSDRRALDGLLSADDRKH
jgi:hypothetical protein